MTWTKVWTSGDFFQLKNSNTHNSKTRNFKKLKGFFIRLLKFDYSIPCQGTPWSLKYLKEPALLLG